MTYKNAMADLPLGGGKAIIMGDSRIDKTEAMLRSFGRFVEGLGGRYVTAEDVGMAVEDMEVVARKTHYVAGLVDGHAASGDPSPYTARGILEGIKAAVKYRLGRSSIKGTRVAVQGVGNVGLNLCRLLRREGAILVVANIDEKAVNRAVTEANATAVPLDEIYEQAVDVFAPCALGAVLRDETIPRLKATIVAGGANNQLAEPRHAAMLTARDILYAPDYIINAGGIINVASEITGDYDQAHVLEHVDRIGNTLEGIFELASERGETTAEIADSMARAKIDATRKASVSRDASNVA